MSVVEGGAVVSIVVVGGAVAAVVVVVLIVVATVGAGLLSSRMLSGVPVPLMGASMQHRMLVGHCTCSKTS